MQARPPRVAEGIVRWLLRHSSLEHVLGDLRERMGGLNAPEARRPYISDALFVVPQVLISSVVRGFDVRLAVLYAAIQYGVFWILAHAISWSAPSLSIVWTFTVGVVLLKLIEAASRPSYGSREPYRMGAVIFFAGSLILYIAVWSAGGLLFYGVLFGGILLNIARRIYVKYVIAPRNPRTL